MLTPIARHTPLKYGTPISNEVDFWYTATSLLLTKKAGQRAEGKGQRVKEEKYFYLFASPFSPVRFAF